MKDLINLTGNLSFDEAKAIIGDYMSVLCVAEKGVLNYAAKPIDKQKHLQTNGRPLERRGLVLGRAGSEKTKVLLRDHEARSQREKITAHLTDFDQQFMASDETKPKGRKA